MLDKLTRVVLSVFDRYPVPPRSARPPGVKRARELARRLQLIGRHPPKRAMDIPEPLAESYLR